MKHEAVGDHLHDGFNGKDDEEQVLDMLLKTSVT